MNQCDELANELVNDVWSSFTNEPFLYGKDLSKFFCLCGFKSKYGKLSEETIAKLEQFIKGKQYMKIQKEYLSKLFKDITNETLESALGFDTDFGNDASFSKLLATRKGKQNESKITNSLENHTKPVETNSPPLYNPKLRSPFSSYSLKNIGSQEGIQRPKISAHRRNNSGSRFSSAGSTSSVSSNESVQSKHRRTASLPYFNNHNFVNNLVNNPNEKELGVQTSLDGLKLNFLDKRRLSPSSIKKNVEDRGTKMKNMLNEKDEQIYFLETELKRMKNEKMGLQSQYEYLTKEFEAFKKQYVVNSLLAEKLKEQSEMIDLLQRKLNPSRSYSKMSTHNLKTKNKSKFWGFSQAVPLLVVCFALVVFFICFRLSSMPFFLNNTKAAEIDSINASYNSVLASSSSSSSLSPNYQLKWFEKYAILTKLYWSIRDLFEPQYIAPINDQNFQNFVYEKLFDLH